jgi:hypothetical protein
MKKIISSIGAFFVVLWHSIFPVKVDSITITHDFTNPDENVGLDGGVGSIKVVDHFDFNKERDVSMDFANTEDMYVVVKKPRKTHDHKNKYDLSEMTIASYIAIHGLGNIDMKQADIARSIKRTPKSLVNKVYKIRKYIKGMPTLSDSDGLIVVRNIKLHDERNYRIKFYMALYTKTTFSSIKSAAHEGLKKMDGFKPLPKS